MTNDPIDVTPLCPDDFAWLKDYDCAPLPMERDSIYLMFCVFLTGTSFVARSRTTGEVRGFLLGLVPAGTGEAFVHYLFVAGSGRHSGVGRTLMHAFSDAAATSGAARVSLFTRRAADFYAKLGFDRASGPFPPALATWVRDVKGAVLMTSALPIAAR
jgi:GNAT superfamily N-acetyltransferase